MRLVWIVLASWLSAACVHHLTGSEVQVWRLRGQVVAVANEALDVRHKSGQIVRLSLDGRTEYYLNRTLASRQIVHYETRVTIEVETSVSGNRALRVDVYR